MNKVHQEFKGHLAEAKLLHVQQVWEGFEIVLGWETRNKYRILDESMKPLAFAAEQPSGILGTLLRQVIGRMRPFKISVFNQSREKMLELEFPFRWFFRTLYLKDLDGRKVGTVQERWAFFRKKFDLLDAHGSVIGKIDSPLLKMWTFEVHKGPVKLGSIMKKWSGALGEIFTDKDNFVINYSDPSLSTDARLLFIAASLMIDIVYFENNQGKGSVSGLFD